MRAAVKTNRKPLWCAAIVVTVSPLVAAPWLQAQRNGEAHSTVPTVERTDYDVRTFMAPVCAERHRVEGQKAVRPAMRRIVTAAPINDLVHCSVSEPSRSWATARFERRKSGRDRRRCLASESTLERRASTTLLRF